MGRKKQVARGSNTKRNKKRSTLIKEEINLPDLVLCENGEVGHVEVKKEIPAETQANRTPEKKSKSFSSGTFGLHKDENSKNPFTKIEQPGHSEKKSNTTQVVTINGSKIILRPCHVILKRHVPKGQNPHKDENFGHPAIKTEPPDHSDEESNTTESDTVEPKTILHPCRIILHRCDSPIRQKGFKRPPIKKRDSSAPQRPPDDLPTTSSEKIKKYKCDYCEKYFYRNSERTIHHRIHTGERPFKCNKCQKSYKSRLYLRVHYRYHTGEKPYKCDKCDKSYYLKPNLIAHRSYKHGEERPFKCDDCQKTFCRKCDLTEHVKIHLGIKIHKCEKCGKAFTRKHTLQTHMDIHLEKRTYKCKECPKTYRTRPCLAGHIRNTHGQKTFYKCNECEKEFVKKMSLARHWKVHIDEKPYKCEECGKAYLIESDLRYHVKIAHSEEKLFQCKKCDKSLTSKFSLNRHLNAFHSEGKRQMYKCEHCPKKLRLKTSLVSHMQIHTGRLYKCDKCEKAYTTRAKLKEHRVRHIVKEPFPCNIKLEKT